MRCAGGTASRRFFEMAGEGEEKVGELLAEIQRAGFLDEGNENKPAPVASNWKELVWQISACEKSKHELRVQADQTRIALEAKIEKLQVEKAESLAAHNHEILTLKMAAEKQVRDAVDKMRREMNQIDNQRKEAETRAEHAEMRKNEAEATARALERRITQLEVRLAQREEACQTECDRVKAETDMTLRSNYEHAEQRIKEMTALARDAQHTMYLHQETLDEERRRFMGRVERERGGGGGVAAIEAAESAHTRAVMIADGPEAITA